MTSEINIPSRGPEEWLPDEAAGDEELLKLLEQRESLFLDAVRTGEGIRNEAKAARMERLLVAIQKRKGLHREP